MLQAVLLSPSPILLSPPPVLLIGCGLAMRLPRACQQGALPSTPFTEMSLIIVRQLPYMTAGGRQLANGGAHSGVGGGRTQGGGCVIWTVSGGPETSMWIWCIGHLTNLRLIALLPWHTPAARLRMYTSAATAVTNATNRRRPDGPGPRVRPAAGHHLDTCDPGTSVQLMIQSFRKTPQA